MAPIIEQYPGLDGTGTAVQIIKNGAALRMHSGDREPCSDPGPHFWRPAQGRSELPNAYARRTCAAGSDPSAGRE
jgi:hypothetical protein